MKKVKKFLVPTVLVVFLMLTVVGSAPASDEQVPLRQGGHTAMVIAGDCEPLTHSQQYVNLGNYLYPSGVAGTFVCPVHFPEPGAHWVYSVYLYVYDFSVPQDIAVNVFKSLYTSMTPTQMGTISSNGASTDQVRVYTLTGAALINRWVLATNRMYAVVIIPAGGNMAFYGLRVMYY